MKKGLLILVLLQFSLPGVTDLNAQSTAEIISRHIDSIGGAKNWDKIQSLVLDEELRTDDATYFITRSIIKNKSLRNDMRIQRRLPDEQDKKYYIILNGNQGWKYMPDTKNTILTLYPSEIAQLQDDLDYEDPFLHYREKGREIEMVNVEYYDSADHYKFLVTYPSGKKIFCYLHALTLMITKTVLLESEVDEIRNYVAYQRLPEGVVVPKEIIDLSGQLSIKSVMINPVLPPHLFKPPDYNKVNMQR